MPCVNHADRDSTAKCITCAAELCDECRTEVDGKNYCAKDVPQAAPAPPPAGAAAPPPPPMAAAAAPAVGTDDPSQEQPIMAALSYIIGILAIIILVTDMKKSRYMRFHGFQALFLIVTWIIFSIAVSVIGALPVIGMLTLIVGPLGGLALLILAIILAVKAYNKQDMEVPVLTKLARDQADKMRV
jgi:uncharacterized membrane protein